MEAENIGYTYTLGKDNSTFRRSRGIRKMYGDDAVDKWISAAYACSTNHQNGFL
jgi:hypothetical protein